LVVDRGINNRTDFSNFLEQIELRFFVFPDCPRKDAHALLRRRHLDAFFFQLVEGINQLLKVGV
jgi:hypothetical protein